MRIRGFNREHWDSTVKTGETWWVPKPLWIGFLRGNVASESASDQRNALHTHHFTFSIFCSSSYVLDCAQQIFVLDQGPVVGVLRTAGAGQNRRVELLVPWTCRCFSFPEKRGSRGKQLTWSKPNSSPLSFSRFVKITCMMKSGLSRLAEVSNPQPRACRFGWDPLVAAAWA